MVRHALVAVTAAVGLLLSVTGPAFAAQPYPLNFNSVDFSSGTISGLVNSGGTLTLDSGTLPSFPYLDPYSSVPVLGATIDGSVDWTAFRITFTAPERSDGIVIRLARDRCTSQICPISGKVWFDDFELKRQ